MTEYRMKSKKEKNNDKKKTNYERLSNDNIIQIDLISLHRGESATKNNEWNNEVIKGKLLKL